MALNLSDAELDIVMLALERLADGDNKMIREIREEDSTFTPESIRSVSLHLRHIECGLEDRQRAVRKIQKLVREDRNK